MIIPKSTDREVHPGDSSSPRFFFVGQLSESAGSISKGSGSESLEVPLFAIGECDVRDVRPEDMRILSKVDIDLDHSRSNSGRARPSRGAADEDLPIDLNIDNLYPYTISSIYNLINGTSATF